MTIVNIQQIQGNFENDFSNKDKNLLQPVLTDNTFNSQSDIIEGHLYNPAGDLLISNYNVTSYSILEDTNEAINNEAGQLYLNPQFDVEQQGYSTGQVNIRYNFLRNILSSSLTSPYYVSEISQDRTEIRLSTNLLDDNTLIESFNSFNEDFQLIGNYTEYYINLGENNLLLFINLILDTTTTSPTILIKLYGPLPIEYSINDTLWIVEQISNSVEFSLEFIEQVDIPTEQIIYLKGPNFNISVDDQTNNTTDYLDYSNLLSTSVSTSFQEVSSLLEEKGININIDYSDYNNFIHFSSAKERLLNFYYKVSLIEQYNNKINLLSSTTGSITGSSIFTNNIIDNQNKRNNIISKFDGYEKFLYFTSGSSKTWPKQTITKPYVLYSTGSSEVLGWIGSFDPITFNGSGELYSSSLYDRENQNNLINTIPSYLREDDENIQYELFLNMIGQHFDNTWIYLKDITEKFDNQNKLTAGISKDLVAQAIRGLGLKIYTGNFTDNNLFGALLGLTPSGSLLPSTGSEVINTYVTASDQSIPTDDYTKEIYKRIYHNLPLLIKSKGTKRGLRALINTFGIPDTILRIDEFGGVDKSDSINEYYYNKYSLALNASSTSSQAVFPYDDSVDSIYPHGIEFRVKSAWSASNSSSREETIATFYDTNNTQNEIIIYTSRSLTDTGSFAELGFQTLGSSYSASIPFYNQDWWNIFITGSGTDWSVYIKNEIEGKIGQEYSGSIILSNPIEGNIQQIVLGNSGSVRNNLDGYYQEFRYWKELSEEDFNYHVINPQSYESSISTSIAGDLLYRNDLGTQLTQYTSSLSNLAPLYSYPTGSLIGFLDNSVSASYSEHEEIYYIHNPSLGIGTRVSDKIRITTPEILQGDTLSYYNSITKPDPYRTQDLPYVEVAFSPQNQINDDIIDQFGFFNIDEYIGDPREIYSSSYDSLNKLQEEYFSKYTKNYNLNDFIRLIKYYDNTLFKMIKDYVPARASLSTGLIIKPHNLERSKIPQTQINASQQEYLGSISTAFLTGSTGGTMPNLLGTSSINLFVPIEQSYTQSFNTPEGLVLQVISTQDEFYNGELPGSTIIATTQSLLNNPLAIAEFENISYTLYIYPLNVAQSGIDAAAPGEIYAVRRTISTSQGGARVDVDTVTEFILHIIDGDGNNLSQIINNATSITIIYSTGTITYQVNGVGQPFSNNISLLVTQNPLSFNPTGATINNIIFEPYTNINAPFENSVYNPIINNATILRKSSKFFNLDYDEYYRIPVNYSTVITSSQLDFKPSNIENYLAEVQDSNYTLRRHTYPRYEGSQLYGARLNNYTTKFSNLKGFKFYDGSVSKAYFNDEFQPSISYTDAWIGDKSYGKEPVINHNNTVLYYCKYGFGGTDQELREWSTFFIDSAYIITNNEATNYVSINSADNFYDKIAQKTFLPETKFEIVPIREEIQSNLKPFYTTKAYGITPDIGDSYFKFTYGPETDPSGKSPLTYKPSNRVGDRYYIGVGSGSISSVTYSNQWKRFNLSITNEYYDNTGTLNIDQIEHKAYTLHLTSSVGSINAGFYWVKDFDNILPEDLVDTPYFINSTSSFGPGNVQGVEWKRLTNTSTASAAGEIIDELFGSPPPLYTFSVNNIDAINLYVRSPQDDDYHEILPDSGYITTYGNINVGFDSGSFLDTIKLDILNGIEYYINFDKADNGGGYTSSLTSTGLLERDTAKILGISYLSYDTNGTASLGVLNGSPSISTGTTQKVIEIDRQLFGTYTGSFNNNDARIFRVRTSNQFVTANLNRITDAPGGGFSCILIPENTSNYIKSNIKKFINKEFIANGNNPNPDSGIIQ
jgi:hypothetical protein